MLTHLLLALSLLAAPLEVGGVAPDFTAADSEGRPQHLTELLSKGPVVLAFFPKAFTPGCTQELTAYQASRSELAKWGLQVLAISSDDAATLKRFAAKLQADYLFVPDPDGRLIKLYDVRQWPLAMAKRTTFVIDRQRHIVRIDRGSDAIDVRGVLRSLAKSQAAPAS